MTDNAAPEYRNEMDTAEVDQLGADDPNVAGREPGSDPVDHEALMGAVEEGPDGAAVDAAAATVEDDVEDAPGEGGGQ